MIRRPRRPTPFPYTTPFQSPAADLRHGRRVGVVEPEVRPDGGGPVGEEPHRRRLGQRSQVELLLRPQPEDLPTGGDRKSTRLNSSHANISYAVFCLKKKN